MLLEGKVAMMTGAGRGHGQAGAVMMAVEGCKMTINDIVAQRAEETVGLIREKGGTAFAAVGDVTDRHFVKGMYEQMIREYGKIDVIINNHAINVMHSFDEIEDEEFEKIVRVNLFGTFVTCREVLPYMRRNGGGKIINVVSTAGKRGGGGAGAAAYSASKAGIMGMSKHLAREVGKDNITVNCLVPGLIESVNIEGLDPEKKAAIISQVALRRMGTFEEIAKVHVFLASSMSDFINGEMMDVDGGWAFDS